VLEPDPEPEPELEAVTVTVAEEVTLESTALTVTEPPEGTLDGAVYRPLLVMVPTVELPPATPFTSQVAAVLVPLTIALNCCVLPAVTLAEVGVTLTATGVAGAVIVRARDVVAVLLAESVTLNPNVLVPAAAGVPERTPEVVKAKPLLQEPEQDATDQV
jgi:hypothetical protein